ncbi:MAG TPA: branched-chain amino acid ABC transporter permease [Syntrophorhabdales bacterium]|nr:branched-chain amino acid ABC transporter permease [Syntrophorhabdales bacterium]
MNELVIPILVTGSITALAALSFQLIFRATGGIFDFAVGQYVVLAGMGSVFLSSETGLPVPITVGCGILFATIAALASETGAIAPLSRLYRTTGAFGPVLGTVALLWVWEQTARLLFGDRPLIGKPFFADVRFAATGLRFTAHQLIIILSAVVVLVAVHLWLEYTRPGRLLRAVGDNRRASEVLGLAVGKARVLAFLGAGIIAGITGVLAGPLSGLAPLSGVAFLISGFVALFLGGSGKTLGAAVGALVLASINIIVSRYLGAAWKDYCVLALALVIFALRPQGIVAPTKRRPS